MKPVLDEPRPSVLARCEMVNRTTLLFYCFTDRFNGRRIFNRRFLLCLNVYKNALAGAILSPALRR
jgi:hypothetical protein